MNRCCSLLMLLIAFPLTSNCLFAQKKNNATYIDPAQVDADYAFQGEYVGMMGAGEEKTRYGLQIIAIGNGKFKSVGYHGGLPGDGWDGEDPMRVDATGELKDGAVTFSAKEHGTGTIKDGMMTVVDPEGKPLGTLKRVVRKSKTLGKKPPESAVVLFDGSDADQWQNGKITKDGLLEQGTRSKQLFGSHQLHIEFLLPYKPNASGQGRGNSGVYIQGRYEVQVLDSFGLLGKMNECGGLYSVKDCDLNMCFPPLTWQTYDIDYTAAKYKDGKVVENPRITVRHNDVVIHNDVELPGNRGTTAAPVKPSAEPGPIYLQNHGNPVRYRNIWVLETDK